jgi:hypothetical protein
MLSEYTIGAPMPKSFFHSFMNPKSLAIVGDSNLFPLHHGFNISIHIAEGFDVKFFHQHL